MTNEGAYLFRKLGAFWGTNNTDHQARICHSTTVTGVANTWGYGAMTNSFNDIRNAKTQIVMGGNPAEAHPVSMQHLLEGKELQKANFIVIDPRMTRTAAHATEYVRMRPGTDIPVLYGMMWHILKNGWEDKEFIKQRVYGFDDLREEEEKWNPEEVERVSGVPGEQLKRVAKMFATEKPATLIWAMGQTQKTVGTANVRASCIALLMTGNVGKAGAHPATWASLAVEAGRKDGVYILPVATQFECKGSRVASTRSLQWGEQIVKPIFESKDDLEVIYLMAKKFGFADKMFKNIKVENNLPEAEDVLREMNRGSWSTGYCGQSPERLKAHMKNQAKFDMLTMQAPKDDPEVGGDYYGLPWPCWGSPEVKHPGTPLLYNTNLAVMDGGGTFRPRFGIEREEKLPDGSTRKVSLLADKSYSKDSEIQDGYPEFTLASLKKVGWDKDLTEAEMATINKVNSANPDAVSWALDLSGGIQRVALKHGCVPYGNGKARMNAFGLPDPIPVHREPIYTPRVDLVSKYPTLPDAKQFRMPNIGFSVQKAAVEKGIAKQFPLVLSSGRLVEYEGGGEETRTNPWLAELQQDMFIEISPADAAERGVKDGGWVWVTGAENNSKAKMKALVTERVGKGVAWMPFHFGGWFAAEDVRDACPT